MSHFPTIRSVVAPLFANDVDTDQIIPARFLKGTVRDGLGDRLFADWRYRTDGSPIPEFVLNDPRYRRAAVLLAGENFGCGSSREHAAWALSGFGFRAVISTGFADIFRGNALKNGILPVTLAADRHSALAEAARRGPVEVTIDLPDQTVTLPDGTVASFPIDAFAKRSLLEGIDELDYLLRFEPSIRLYEQTHGISIGAGR